MARDRRTRRQRIGQRCEDAALAFLTKRGLRLACRNYATRTGEIDLIMLDGAVLVFVEVRYRRSTSYGGASASVDLAKQRRIFLSAARYLQQHRQHRNRRCRFDVIVFGTSVRQPDNWIRGAFQALPE